MITFPFLLIEEMIVFVVI